MLNTELKLLMPQIAGRHLAKTVAIVCAVSLAGATLAASEAAAQTFGYGWLNDPPPKKKKKPRASASKETADKSQKAPEKQPNGPLVITVSLKAQRLQVFDADGLVATAPISSGRVGNATPMGVFSILEKNKHHVSNLYGAAMPNMNRITWSGVAMHAGVLPGYPASHGCIRLPHAFSSKLFGITKLGHRVIVARDPLTPQPISHDKLFTAYPPEPALTTASVTAPASAQVADASRDGLPPGAPISDTPQAASVLGVTAANAAAATPPASEPAPVNPYRAKWLAEMDRLSAAIPAADDAKAKAEQAVLPAVEAADAAKAVWKTARADADKTGAERKKAQKSLDAADGELKSFVRKVASDKKVLSGAAAEKAAGSEDEIEARIAEATKALEEATAAAALTREPLKAAEAAKKAAEDAKPRSASTVRDTQKAWKEARDAASRAEANQKSAEQALDKADADLAALAKQIAESEAATIQAAETEEKLEARITEATRVLEAAAAEDDRATAKLKEAEAAAMAAETARKAAIKTLSDADQALVAAIEADAAAKRREAKRAHPISVFVSLKTQKLYIRQGYEPVYEVPVTIANPEKPIGTHTFTAIGIGNDKTSVKWTVVSVPTLPQQKQEKEKEKSSKKKSKETDPLASALPADFAASEQTAAAALDRITFPDEVREIVADSMKPGSSLLISDYGVSNETGKFTDFIVGLR